MIERIEQTTQQLVEHVCGETEFNEQAAFDVLENYATDHDWQKKLVQLLRRLSDQCIGN